MRRETQRRAFTGIVIVLALVVMLVLSSVGIASVYQSNGALRVTLRVEDVRLCLEASDSALAEAMVVLRRSLDSGVTSANCPDNWRGLLRDVLEHQAALPKARHIVPAVTRSTFSQQLPECTISDVTIDLMDSYVPGTPVLGHLPRFPPQMVFEVRVRVQTGQGVRSASRTVRQRWTTYVLASQEHLRLARLGIAPPPDSEIFTLLPTPLATVVE